MRQMKDSGIEWIGQIPESWDTAKLLYLLRKPISDGPHETPEVLNEGIPFISVDSLNDTEDIDFSVVKKFISEEQYVEYQRKANLEEGDILFSKAATIGKTAIVKKEKFMVWSPLAIIKVDQKKLFNIEQTAFSIMKISCRFCRPAVSAECPRSSAFPTIRIFTSPVASTSVRTALYFCATASAKRETSPCATW